MDLATYLSQPGAVVALAVAIDVAPSLVSQWKNGTRRVPSDRCPSIERATGGIVRCEVLRPDVDWAYLRGTDCPTNKQAA
jgi:DNA-binding transcriptional regulator YdaS (Cro superfamily)